MQLQILCLNRLCKNKADGEWPTEKHEFETPYYIYFYVTACKTWRLKCVFIAYLKTTSKQIRRYKYELHLKFSICKEEVENVSANQRPVLPFLLTY